MPNQWISGWSRRQQRPPSLPRQDDEEDKTPSKSQEAVKGERHGCRGAKARATGLELIRNRWKTHLYVLTCPSFWMWSSTFLNSPRRESINLTVCPDNVAQLELICNRWKTHFYILTCPSFWMWSSTFLNSPRREAINLTVVPMTFLNCGPLFSSISASFSAEFCFSSVANKLQWECFLYS